MKSTFQLFLWHCCCAGAFLCLPLKSAGQTAEPALLTNVRQLLYEGQRSGEGYFSSDGDALIFQSEREPGNPFYQIYILNLDTGDSHRVSPGFGKTTCAFFRPGSSEVLFASTHLDPKALAKQKEEIEFRASGKQRRYSWDYDEAMDIFSSNRDGSNLRRLTDAPGYDAEGAYSPDGKLIVFCSLRAGYPASKLSPEDRKRLETDPAWFGDIYLMNADGTHQRRLTSAPGYDGGPFFSPDGQRIVWRRFHDNGAAADVFTMNLDGSDARKLTSFDAMSWAPYFHPSGEYVIFTSNKLGFGNFELYLVDAAGTQEPVRVTFTDGFDGLPVFAPNGRQLAWTSTRTSDGKSQIFLGDWNHEAALAALKASRKRTEPPASQPAAAPPSFPVEAAQGFSAEIKNEDLQRQVRFLASPELKGRLTGSPENAIAAQYAARLFQSAGLDPSGDNGTWLQTFHFNSGVRVLTNQNRFALTAPARDPKPPQLGVDYNPLSFTANGTVEGAVVFAGYGLAVPGKPGEGYDSYAGLNVSNKIALVLRYVPEGVEPKRRQELNRYAGLRYKAMIARERGAKALLVATGPNSPNAGELVPLTFDSSIANSDIIAFSVASNLVSALLEGTGKDLKSLQSSLDTENPHAEGGFEIPELQVRITAAVEHLRKSDNNILAVLPPGKPTPSPEYILVGAHYDHLGLGEAGAMLRPGETGQVHFGADDNASGTAAVLELAASLAAARQEKPETFARGVVFALWSGEELGLIGSTHFASHPAVPLSNVTAYVNFDMVGRLRENKLNLQGIGSSPAWKRLIERRNVRAGFNLVLQEDPYLPTDVTAFYPKQIPVLNFFTGGHEDYHRPTDTPETLNYEGLERITRFAHHLILDLVTEAERPAYAAVSRGQQQGGGRDNLRAYLGTIPDYATEVVGVKIAGTRAGSPGEKAGLVSGDIIVEFAGQKISNIYDYTYALDAVKIGQPIKVVVKRQDKSLQLTVIPEARK